MSSPLSGDEAEISFAIVPADGKLPDAAPLTPFPDPPAPKAWQPSGRPLVHTAQPTTNPDRIPALLAFGVFAAIFGPGVIKSVLVTGFVLGGVSPNLLYDVQIHSSTWAVYTITAALLYGGSELVWRRNCGYPLPARLAQVPVWLMAALVLAGGAGAAWAAIRLDRQGSDAAFVCVEAFATAIWFVLLCPAESTGVLGRAPGHAHVGRAAKIAAVSMLGFAAGTPAVANLILEWMVDRGPTAMAGRLAAAYRDGYASTGGCGCSGHPGLGSFRSVMALLANYAANAFAEELVFAAIVLTLARLATRPWAIVATAALLRVLMHLYYGPPGFAMGLFSGVNAWALLRWRRLAPLIACHFVYDVILWAGVREGWLSGNTWTQYGQLIVMCMSAVLLFWLVGAIVRRGRLAVSAQAAAA